MYEKSGHPYSFMTAQNSGFKYYFFQEIENIQVE